MFLCFYAKKLFQKLHSGSMCLSARKLYICKLMHAMIIRDSNSSDVAVVGRLHSLTHNVIQRLTRNLIKKIQPKYIVNPYQSFMRAFK